jgi:hypothetical protein
VEKRRNLVRFVPGRLGGTTCGNAVGRRVGGVEGDFSDVMMGMVPEIVF